MGYLASIDLGTSSVKVLITDIAGKNKGIGQVGYDINTPKVGFVEQDPEIWWQSTVLAIKQALAKSNISSKDILCIGFSGQMHGLIAIGKNGNPVCPAIIWMDQRSILESEFINEIADKLLYEELLNQPSAGMLICSLAWIRKNNPNVYENIDKVMLPKDYIRYRLTGIVETDYSDASATLAFSVKNRKWCNELIKKMDLKDDIWPNVRAPYELVGQISKHIAAQIGLSEKTQIVMGGADAAMQLIGNGVVEEGTVACNIGTASQIAAVVKQPISDPKMRCQTWCHALPNTWYIQGGTLNGGSTVSWLKQKILKDDRTFSELDIEAASIQAGSEGLIFIPYLAGERTPVMDPKARGVYFGLTMKHEQSHIIRATMEGVMYNLKECEKIFDDVGIKKEKLISSGGGSKGNTWKQIQADIFNIPVFTTKTEEEACLGAVIMAAVGMGFYSSVEEACHTIVEVSDIPIEPIPENVERYKQMQEIFHDLYLNTKSLYPRIYSL